MKNYEVLADALKDLKARGYTRYFEMEYFAIYCGLLELRLDPEEFNVDEIYRFRNNSNPDDSTALYAVTSAGGVKGTLVDAYDADAGKMSFAMAIKLQGTNELWVKTT